MYDVRCRRRRERQHRRVRLDRPTARPAPRSTPTSELLGTAVWPAAPAIGRPDAVGHRHLRCSTLCLDVQLPAQSAGQDAAAVRGSFKISALRAPNAPQTTSPSEQIVDELALAAGMDPVAFRRQNIDGHDACSDRAGSPALDAATIAAGWKPKVAALEPAERKRRSPAAASASGTFASQPGRRRRRHPGEQEDRQDPRQAPLRRPEQRDHDRARAGHEPDDGRCDPGSLAGDVGEADVQQGAGHEPRLGLLPDPALRRHARR